WEELQRHYNEYQDKAFFIKLEKSSEGEKQSYISHVKTFPNDDLLMDYFYDTEYERACILIRFEEPIYIALCQGFYVGNLLKITPDLINIPRRQIDCSGDHETRKKVPREILRGFSEIADAVISLKKAA